MAVFTFFNSFKRYLTDGTIDLDSHTFKAVLAGSPPAVTSNTILANMTQIANGNGYTIGGLALTSVIWAETGVGTGIFQFTSSDLQWTAAGGSIGPFRYVVVYDDTPTSPVDPLVGYWDYGSDLSVPNGNAFRVTASNGIFQLA